MDIFDFAQELDARFTAQAIQSALPATPARLSAELCAWCDSPIPEARRLAVPGCDLCIKCQAQKERLGGLR